MRLIMFTGIYVKKYQITAHSKGWVCAYLRGLLFDIIVSRVGAYSDPSP